MFCYFLGKIANGLQNFTEWEKCGIFKSWNFAESGKDFFLIRGIFYLAEILVNF